MSKRIYCIECRGQLDENDKCQIDPYHFATPEQCKKKRATECKSDRLAIITAATLQGKMASNSQGFEVGGEMTYSIKELGRICAEIAIAAEKRLVKYERWGE